VESSSEELEELYEDSIQRAYDMYWYWYWYWYFGKKDLRL
jgi:hypothetical protein